ncbi:hypothetical protein ACI65C_005039 [Semiaphis heraclei]
MEEIDAIIYCTLKDIGCEFSENENAFTSIAQENLIKAIIMCLQKIEPTINLSFTIPRSMSARYQYGITVAEACKKVGYKSDIGYQTILYGNIVDIRRILMFLIEKLPKEIEDTIELKSKRCTILKKLKKSLSTKRQSSNSSLFPSYSYVSVPLETGITVPGHKRNCTPAEWRNFCINSLKYITEQPLDLKYLIPSLITHNIKRLLNIYEFELRTSDDLSKSRTFKGENKKINSKQTSNLNTEVKKVSKDQVEKISKESESTYIERLVSKNNELKNLTLNQHSTKINLMLKLEKLEKEIAVQEKSLNIIDNPEVLIKLKNKVDAAPDKIKRMGIKWSKYETEQNLILSELNDELNKKRAKNIKLETVYGNEKLKLQNIFEDIQKKEDIIKICRNDLDSKPNYNSRSVKYI